MAAGACVGLPLALFLAWFVPAKLGWFATDRAAAITRYAQAPSSRFITVDGVPLHVRVEGKGPPVLLLHGTGVNLHEWDPLVDRLSDRYTLIRVDWPPYGLSGPNPHGYTTAEAARLVGLVLDQLAVGPLTVVATSNGCNVALELNAANPDRIRAMAFSMLPLERPSQTRQVDWRIRWMLAFHNAVLPDYHPRFFYSLVLQDTSHPGWQVPPYLAGVMYDMANLPGAIANQQAYLKSNIALFRTTDVGATAGQVRAPVLLQWSDEDTVISQSADASVRRFTGTQVKLIHYPGIGHWPMWETPDRFAADLGAFLGTLPPPAAAP
ncbi:alpha/beta hydrolase [Nitrospirillum sp. BR 11752]|uniref:alpha/beta fold hydrolase n=1 Tax=Nitrospirillum sp. BR 11752 TaxID=3104293 RepID=UPI002EA1458D|nr:alpha/beta hydrolase [Nitrospirillum sp. BR 11752]